MALARIKQNLFKSFYEVCAGIKQNLFKCFYEVCAV